MEVDRVLALCRGGAPRPFPNPDPTPPADTNRLTGERREGPRHRLIDEDVTKHWGFLVKNDEWE